METGLREIDRARAVLIYGSQLADPRRDPNYWKTWHEFEVSYGNEETFREMLRVKRSVQAAYNAAEKGAGLPQVGTLTEDDAIEMIRREAELEGVSLEKKTSVGGFVQSRKHTADAMSDLGEAAFAAGGGGGGEIDIDDEDEEDEVSPAPEIMKWERYEYCVSSTEGVVIV
jgi:pre-mRNA-splicing factor SYF1